MSNYRVEVRKVEEDDRDTELFSEHVGRLPCSMLEVTAGSIHDVYRKVVEALGKAAQADSTLFGERFAVTAIARNDEFKGVSAMWMLRLDPPESPKVSSGIPS